MRIGITVTQSGLAECHSSFPLHLAKRKQTTMLLQRCRFLHFPSRLSNSNPNSEIRPSQHFDPLCIHSGLSMMTNVLPIPEHPKVYCLDLCDLCKMRVCPPREGRERGLKSSFTFTTSLSLGALVGLLSESKTDNIL